MVEITAALVLRGGKFVSSTFGVNWFELVTDGKAAGAEAGAVMRAPP